MLKYKVGDRVRIVSKWADPNGPQNRDGKMNCWLGKIMTVAYVNGYNCRMMEDNGLWCWNDSLIAGLAEASESIHITRDGNTVHAVHKREDKVVGRASAKCSPDDAFDFSIGAKLAVERVFAVREVSRPAKVGEYIKLVTSGGYSFSKVGDIALVTSVVSGLSVKARNDAFKRHNGDGSQDWLFTIREYVVLDGYTPPESSTPKTRSEIMRKYLGMPLDDLTDRICDNRRCAQCPIFQENVGSDDIFCRLWAAKHSDAAKYLIAAKLTEEELESIKEDNHE